MTIICALVELFDTYTSCKGKYVFMENNAESKCIGMRMVKIKMFDGIVRSLTNVMHVLDL